MTVSRAIHFTVLIALALPGMAAAQTQMRSAPVPDVSGGFGVAVFSFRDATGAGTVRPNPPETSRFGGGLWFGIKAREHLRVVFDLSGYNQPWTPRTSLSGRTTYQNDVGFIVAGPRLMWSSERMGEPYVQVLVGQAMSDRSPGGTVVMLGAGIDGGLRCRATATCVLGIELGYRRVAKDPKLSGFRSVLRIGIGF